MLLIAAVAFYSDPQGTYVKKVVKNHIEGKVSAAPLLLQAPASLVFPWPRKPLVLIRHMDFCASTTLFFVFSEILIPSLVHLANFSFLSFLPSFLSPSLPLSVSSFLPSINISMNSALPVVLLGPGDIRIKGSCRDG